ncbi:hypothetical protein BDQ12DRAFT_682472 [Crucibulum laeve]|uniref:Uncharacterized protein n=1 Tax=Crucibulum laeve TaxID=68775 RepID=A0A5C3MDN9_9AGAR|nr:hypothetical protein BDQ12DRAFT_682472 [Crucibulum laeve]
MGYQRVMGFDHQICGNQVDGSKNLWVIVEYGFSQIWVKTENTVFTNLPKEKCMGFAKKSYGLWGIGELWISTIKYARSKLVDPKIYGLS